MASQPPIEIDSLLIIRAKEALSGGQPVTASLKIVPISAPYGFLHLVAFDGGEGALLAHRFRANRHFSFGDQDYILVADLTKECGGSGTFATEIRTPS